MAQTKPLDWIVNERATSADGEASLDAVMPAEDLDAPQHFHGQLPGFAATPLHRLDGLAAALGIKGLWLKDEAPRLGLNSFKALGGSFAINKYLQKRLGVSYRGNRDLSFRELTSPDVRERLGEITFASATDGNHGKGVAWAASKLGQKSVIYVHSKTSQARIDAIAEQGAEVRVVDGTYDDAVRQITLDAKQHGWQVISDTSWEGYEEIPVWVMQGYSTLCSEAQEQLANAGNAGVAKPTHLFLQGGVGALAASGVGYYHRMFGSDAPICTIVEPAKAACLLESARAGDGKPHNFAGDLDTIMAGLACGEPSPVAWNLLWNHADAFVAVPDYVTAEAMRVLARPLADDPPAVSGESGAVTLGALMFLMTSADGQELRQSLELGPDSHVLLVSTEGDTDPEDYRRVVEDGAHPVPEKYRLELGRAD